MPSWYDEDGWYGTLLSGLFNFRASLSVLQVVAWFGYLVPTLVLFLRQPGGSTSRTAAPTRTEQPASA